MNLRIALIITIVAAFSLNTYAGGYHCKLKIESFKQPYDNTLVLKVSKIEPDSAPYLEGKAASWDMVQLKVGETFTLHFKVEQLDDKGKACIAHIRKSHKAGVPVEFGFNKTANNLQGKRWFVSTALTHVHKTKDGAICVHGS